MESGWEQIDVVMESKYGLTELNTKDNGSTIKQVGRENLPIFMEMFMKGIGKTIRPLGSESILMRKQTQDIRVIGKMICNMGLEFKFMLMEIDTKACSAKEKDMGKENIFFPMALFTTGNGRMAE